MSARWMRDARQLLFDLFAPSTPAPPAEQPAPPAEEPVLQGNGSGRNPANGLENVTIVFSSRLKRAWRLEKPRSPVPDLVVPKSFQEAPDAIWACLGRWVEAHRRPSPGSRARARLAARQVFDWMGPGLDRTPTGSSRGQHHDLQPLFDRLNRERFGGALSALVRWSPRPGGLSTHRTLDLPEGPLHVLTIGQLYDHPDVPEVALMGVLHHEMLHIDHPPSGSGARRHVHHAEFRRAEQAFPGYQAWKEWEMRHAPRLLRSLHRARRSRSGGRRV